MSKIQKAIQAIRAIEKQKANDPENSPMLPLGKVIRERAEKRSRELREENEPSHNIEINREALRRAGFFAPEDEERILVDEYRQIKRPLIAHAFGKRADKIQDGHLILVTSAIAGEGKTFTCINLALSLAREQDRSVLLIDADLVKSHITRLFGAEDRLGLLDLLEKDSGFDLDDVILSTDIEGLSVMTSGAMRTHSSELLASERMESVIRALNSQAENRIVLFDSSPLLMTSEAKILTSLVGQVVLVVAAEQTPQQAVFDAIATIDEGKAVNLVLNQARHASGNGYYGYGYGAGGKDHE